MHLINTSTFELTWFSEKIPPYAILSHTWGLEEVTFEGFGDLLNASAKAGFYKIQRTCEQALQDGLQYAWVDTCCINKQSSAELSEAINCMFKWYRDAVICYAYIDDLTKTVGFPKVDHLLLKGCRWFSRGWTLQELLAPTDIVFFGAQWVQIGRKAELEGILEQVTGIPHAVLARKTRLDQVSVADRMKWASNRRTTREEDIAYCLMGIFDVNMPMMYGERRKAFIRLQEEIVKQTQDDSMFAWRASQQSAVEAPYRGLFASSPKEFASDDTITPFYTHKAGETTILDNGRVSISCALHQDGVLSLKCFQSQDISSVVGIKVIRTGSNNFLRSNPTSLVSKPHQNPVVFETVVFDKFAEMPEPSSVDDVYGSNGIQPSQPPPEIKFIQIYPTEYQDYKTDRIVPLVYVIGKKIAFLLEIEKEASGVFLQHNSTLDRFSEQSPVRLLLIVWVDKIPGTASYRYYFDLKRVLRHDAESLFLQAEKPPADVDYRELIVELCTVKVEGNIQKVNKRQMFSLQSTFAVRETARAEAEAYVKAEAEEREVRGRIEAEAQEARERIEAETQEEQERTRKKVNLNSDIRRFAIASTIAGAIFVLGSVLLSTLIPIGLKRTWLLFYLGAWAGSLLAAFSSCCLCGALPSLVGSYKARRDLENHHPNRSGAVITELATV